ncbi:hypothetical protein SAMN06266787_104225 [Halorubrum ezzemoulense]|uniref:Uncharacterized protein n=1 Tax=Halorubrum ezzemoulense TaxID=337243 RepID=A0A238XFX8_HALEZ|nr:hypothetical protein SAMN06266787_104225 [Halorubrum ezzemoulense]
MCLSSTPPLFGNFHTLFGKIVPVSSIFTSSIHYVDCLPTGKIIVINHGEEGSLFIFRSLVLLILFIHVITNWHRSGEIRIHTISICCRFPHNIFVACVLELFSHD